MGRIIVFYLAALAWLAGFGVAAVASPTPGAVLCGTVGLLAFLAVTIARIGSQQPPAGRSSRTVRGGG